MEKAHVILDDDKLIEIRKKIESGFYDSEEVLYSLADAIIEVITRG